jgi:hypothetical protein
MHSIGLAQKTCYHECAQNFYSSVHLTIQIGFNTGTAHPEGFLFQKFDASVAQQFGR